MAADRATTTQVREAEETFELRLERLMIAKGRRKMVDYLEQEVKERPRAYVKAWLANYLIYAPEFGLKELFDPARGYKLACEARDEGSLFGLELMGRAWGDARTGHGYPSHDLALELLLEAAEQGRHTAMSALGEYYFIGKGVPVDRTKAEGWVRKAAWQGATGAMFNFARWWEDPQRVGTPDVAKANALYYEVGELGERSALALLRDRAKAGDRNAEKYVHLDLVVSSLRGYDALPSRLRAAVKWLEANGAADDWPVQVALADVMKEKTLPVYDADAARSKLTQAASAGYEGARAVLAMMAWRGIGQKADKVAAVAAWRELAAKGDPESLNQFGWLHWWGEGEKLGVPKDGRLAFEFCRKSADRGHWSGQLNVAECYAHGIGVPVNYFMAGKYYGILADRRYKNAARMKERILGYVKD